MKVGTDVVYMAADDEEDYHITHRSVLINDKNCIEEEWVAMRFRNFDNKLFRLDSITIHYNELGPV